ncbi:folylpolyglutamate synthase [Williamsoniiplasma somnilux]|uniref:tetrahydrofolate synthase n=1 Tax=Williamsoniiplasma somnilux TaxID=215578 RepID=A0A2K8P2B5_9MOLU|nr:Mur ligase family protein [Williamsoniiplasma somnilux]ATZ19033.1 folylpolyglutamate synthase [Williamsoniiplasma somnilux]
MIKVSQDIIPVNKRFAQEYNLGKVLNILGNPEKLVPTINIVGTNGKGSTSFYLSKVLLKKYSKVGLFISPAFLHHNERIQINNIPISDDDLMKYLELAKKYVDEYHLTFFEIWTLIMILYFADQKVDIAVIEAGIGGVKDSTNFMSNQIATLLTSVSIDHTEVLGETIEEILFQKVNIVKNNKPLFISKDNEKYFSQIKNMLPNNQIIIGSSVFDRVSYQENNKGLVKVFLTFLEIEDETIFKLNPPLGRFTILNQDPFLIIDGAHNSDGIKNLIKTVKYYNEDFIVLFASSFHKDFQTNLKMLNENFKEVYITSFEHLKAWNIEEINYPNKIINWKNFLQNNKTKNILICGSLYFVPEVFEWYNLNM